MGVQGKKRMAVAGADAVATVDPLAPADYAHVQDVPLDAYDAALLCIPDADKIGLIAFLLANGKHVLVEKPLFGKEARELQSLHALASGNGVVCYTAYNHRFEPNFERMRATIASGVLGRLYTIRLFYGNGTARLVRESAWRDRNSGVLPDLGSHLLDTLSFWLGQPEGEWRISAANRFENRSFDHVVCRCKGPIDIELEMTLLSWRNHFTCDVLAEAGSAHISSLCKWGPAEFVLRRRKLPSGRPDEEREVVAQGDPTWELEYAHFKRLCADPARAGYGNGVNDIWIGGTLAELARQAGCSL